MNLWYSSSAKNAATSLIAFTSSALCGLISIPVAVAYLSKEQIGLWSIVTVVITYLLWLDLGIGNATGRKIAPAIANHDSAEISRWWTLSISVLALLAACMLGLSYALSFLLPSLLAIPDTHSKDAVTLFLGVACVSAAGMPLRAYPGILLAQDRFHWVSISQTLSSWIQFPVFWLLLHHGFGIHSYFYAFFLSNLSGWILFAWKVHRSLPNLRLDFTALNRQRFVELLKFSGSLAVGGLSDAFIQSLPALILARFGGLHIVPIYNLTQRGPQILTNLSQRMLHAFYPDLQKTFVAGETNSFFQRYQSVCTFSIWFSLAAAGSIITFNRPLTCWLANEGFYAGYSTNLIFACSVVVFPFVSATVHLLQLSGDMGKMSLISIIELPLSLLLCYAGYTAAGTTGIATACVLTPLLLRAPYCIHRSCLNCDTSPYELFRKPIGALIICLLALLTTGIVVSQYHTHAPQVMIFGRPTSPPQTIELIIGLSLIMVAAWQICSILQQMRRPAQNFFNTV
jgi:O-antigen/teichoic acid export membrane protein